MAAPNRKWIVISGVLLLGGSIAVFYWLRGGTQPPPTAAKPHAAASPPAPAPAPAPVAEGAPPFLPQKNAIVASDMGGIIESITSELGPRFNGNRLIDGPL